MLPLLRINDLSIDFVSESGITAALKNISFSVDRNEIFAIVGESGSGKSVTALSILQLLSKTAAFKTGEILFSEDGKNVRRRSLSERFHISGNRKVPTGLHQVFLFRSNTQPR